jgi:hypothetical protein
LTFFKGRARALAPFATAFLIDRAFSEMDDEIDECDWVDEASDTGLEFLP